MVEQTREEIEGLREIANQDITRIFDALEIDYEDNFKSITAPCPIHNGDRRDAWSWHIDYGMYQCFSRGCHEAHGKDIYGLVRGIKDCGFAAAVQFVKDVYSDQVGNFKAFAELRENRKFVAKIRKQKEPEIFPERSLEKLRYHTYLESRGYPRPLIEDYQIGIAPSGNNRLSNRIIVPIRDVSGRLIGFTGRTLKENWKELKIGKWEHTDDFDKEHSLFNIDRAAKHITDTGIAIITEGPLDVLRLEQAGVHNSVAIFGRKLYNGQISALIAAGANKIFVALDADEAGSSGAQDALKTAGLFFDVSIIKLENGDVGDLPVEKVKKVFNEIWN